MDLFEVYARQTGRNRESSLPFETESCCEVILILFLSQILHPALAL